MDASDLDRVNQLLADPTADVDPRGECLSAAVARGDLDLVERLLAHPRMYDYSSMYSAGMLEFGSAEAHHVEKRKQVMGEHLFDAASVGHVEIIKMLLKDSRVDPAAFENKAIIAAAQEGHDRVLRMLLKDGRADPGLDNNKALWGACHFNHSRAVKHLLDDPRVDPSVGGTNKPIECAAEHDNVSVLRALIKYPRVYTSPLSDKVRALVEPTLAGSAWWRRRHAVHARALRARGLV